MRLLSLASSCFSSAMRGGRFLLRQRPAQADPSWETSSLLRFLPAAVPGRFRLTVFFLQGFIGDDFLLLLFLLLLRFLLLRLAGNETPAAE